MGLIAAGGDRTGRENGSANLVTAAASAARDSAKPEGGNPEPRSPEKFTAPSSRSAASRASTRSRLQNLETVLRIQSRTPEQPRGTAHTAAALTTMGPSEQQDPQKLPDGRNEHTESELKGSSARIRRLPTENLKFQISNRRWRVAGPRHADPILQPGRAASVCEAKNCVCDRKNSVDRPKSESEPLTNRRCDFFFLS